MIKYRTHLFGFSILNRLHGSAVLKAIVPAAISTVILLVAVYGFNNDIHDNESKRVTTDSYAIGVFLAFFTFLITFRANFSYGRYWEGATTVHEMMSRWLDVGMNLAAHHYQCAQYQPVRPPSFGLHPNLKNLTLERERINELTEEQCISNLQPDSPNSYDEFNSIPKQGFLQFFRTRRRPEQQIHSPLRKSKSINSDESEHGTVTLPVPAMSRRSRPAMPCRPSQRLDKVQSIAQLDGGVPSPSLFLQEAAHLISLLAAVAMSTLRNDLEGSECPLVEHIPGRPWPPVDPDQLSDEIRVHYHESSHLLTSFFFLLGFTRSDRHRTLYNAARPFRVLGGVSDHEMEQLRDARGPCAKVALCAMWLREFISREHLAGSTGAIAPPIISQIFKMTSDGMIGYNQSRKIAYIPFPFPHAQLTIFFICAVIWVFPLLFYSYVNNMIFACLLNFTTVICFVGLHEVARELEDPFHNVPNDLPLTTFQCEFNEALIAMYAGFHPDAWWEVPFKDLADLVEDDDDDLETKTPN